MAKANPKLVEEIFNELKELLNYFNCTNDNKNWLAWYLIEVINLNPGLEEAAFIELAKIFNNSIYRYGIVKINEGGYNRSVSIKDEAAKVLIKVIKETSSLTEEAFMELINSINKGNFGLTYHATVSLVEIVKGMCSEEVFKVFKIIFNASDYTDNAKCAAIEALIEVIKAKPNLAEEAFTELKKLPRIPFIQTVPNEKIVKSEAAQALIKIVKIEPRLAENTYLELAALLNDPDLKVYYLKMALGLIEIAKTNVDLRKKLLQEFEQEFIIHRSKSYGTDTPAQALHELLKIMPLEESFKEIIRLLNNKCSVGLGLLNANLG